VCDCGSAGGSFINVTVERCAAPNYIRCRRTKSGKLVCPIKDHPRRVFTPEPAR
jgi:hypothetical protein